MSDDGNLRGWDLDCGFHIPNCSAEWNRSTTINIDQASTAFVQESRSADSGFGEAGLKFYIENDVNSDINHAGSMVVL